VPGLKSSVEPLPSSLPVGAGKRQRFTRARDFEGAPVEVGDPVVREVTRAVDLRGLRFTLRRVALAFELEAPQRPPADAVPEARC
jgi:hypothetical protein